MKNLILFILISFLIISCQNGKTTINKEETKEKYQGMTITEYVYDGCEYVKFPAYNATWGSHKGNCKNPIHLKNGNIDIKFYSLDGKYDGYLPCDSMVVNYNKKRLECYSNNKIVFVTELKDMGIIFSDLIK